MATAGRVPGSSAAITSAQVVALAGRARSVRTVITCSGWDRRTRTASRMWLTRSKRSSSTISTVGWLSSSAYSISCGVHQAFMPTQAAPRAMQAQ